MKEFTFAAWCRRGKWDSGESWIDVELTEEESDRLLSYGTKIEIYYNGFSQCKELEDLYKRIYDIAVNQMTEEVRDFGGCEGEDVNNPDWKINDVYQCGVNFPIEFEDMLLED